MGSEKNTVELIALLLLVPLISFSGGEPTAEITKAPEQHAVVSFSEGQWKIQPPEDSSLTMTVVESRRQLRGPASGPTASRRIDVIVAAP